MDITTFNVNSLRAREERFKLWLEARRPSVLCLQETKVRDEEFPVGIFEERGYSVIYHGQPTYNGVAIAVASGLSVSDPVIGLPPAVEPDQCRFLSLQVEGIRVVNVYVPNGGEVDGPRYAYKLEWLRRLKEHLTAQHSASEPLVVCGDFNVALDDRDVFDPEAHRGQILCSDPERARMAELMSFGLVDLHRKFTQEGGIYTWWDYRNLGFQKNRGFRIDLFLATSTLADRCLSVEIDRAERKGTKPSDHAPVRATFSY
jgi:exodeoxyribonuclease-3